MSVGVATCNKVIGGRSIFNTSNSEKVFGKRNSPSTSSSVTKDICSHWTKEPSNIARSRNNNETYVNILKRVQVTGHNMLKFSGQKRNPLAIGLNGGFSGCMLWEQMISSNVSSRGYGSFGKNEKPVLEWSEEEVCEWVNKSLEELRKEKPDNAPRYNTSPKGISEWLQEVVKACEGAKKEDKIKVESIELNSSVLFKQTVASLQQRGLSEVAADAIIEQLQDQRPGEILRARKVTGKGLIQMTEEELISYGLAPGTATELMVEIAKLKESKAIIPQISPERLKFILSASLESIYLPATSNSRMFNYAGPVDFTSHYAIPGFLRSSELARKEIDELVGAGKYFILHEQRQSGKTSYIKELEEYFNSKKEYAALYINVETAGVQKGKGLSEGMRAILEELCGKCQETFSSNFSVLERTVNMSPLKQFEEALKRISRVLYEQGKKFVLFVDEIDSLQGDILLSVLRQLRSGYTSRQEGTFPHSVALVGVRDVRDYRVYSDIEEKQVFGGSAFNIKAATIRVARFKIEHVRALVLQHENTTKQKWDEAAIQSVYSWTDGQPWCVNRVCFEAVKRISVGSEIITKDDIEEAVEAVIQKNETHLDQLVHILSDERVRRVVAPLIAGREPRQEGATDEDLRFTVEQGLVKLNDKSGLYMISNRMYQEVIPRQLVALNSFVPLHTIDRASLFEASTGRLKMDGPQGFIQRWIDFHLQHVEAISDSHQYKEIVFHIIFFAFAQRIVNGGGQVRREAAIGNDAADVIINMPLKDGTVQTEVIELKVHRDRGWPTVINSTKNQIIKYLQPLRLDHGYILVFHQKKARTLKGQAIMNEQVAPTVNAEKEIGNITRMKAASEVSLMTEEIIEKIKLTIIQV